MTDDWDRIQWAQQEETRLFEQQQLERQFQATQRENLMQMRIDDQQRVNAASALSSTQRIGSSTQTFGLSRSPGLGSLRSPGISAIDQWAAADESAIADRYIEEVEEQERIGALRQYEADASVRAGEAQSVTDIESIQVAAEQNSEDRLAAEQRSEQAAAVLREQAVAAENDAAASVASSNRLGEIAEAERADSLRRIDVMRDERVRADLRVDAARAADTKADVERIEAILDENRIGVERDDRERELEIEAIERLIDEENIATDAIERTLQDEALERMRDSETQFLRATEVEAIERLDDEMRLLADSLDRIRIDEWEAEDLQTRELMDQQAIERQQEERLGTELSIGRIEAEHRAEAEYGERLALETLLETETAERLLVETSDTERRLLADLDERADLERLRDIEKDEWLRFEQSEEERQVEAENDERLRLEALLDTAFNETRFLDTIEAERRFDEDAITRRGLEQTDDALFDGEGIDTAMDRFDTLEVGNSPDPQGALLSDLMRHGDARAIKAEINEERAAKGLPPLKARPGKTPKGESVNPEPAWQSAHTTPEAVRKNLPRTVRDNLFTRFMPSGKGHKHYQFDQHWQRSLRKISKETGKEAISVAELEQVMIDAIDKSGAFTPEEAVSMKELVKEDLYVQMKLSPDSMVLLPGVK